MSAATVAQLVSAVATIIYAGVIVVAYYVLIRMYREMTGLYREMLDEMREARFTKDRPQVLVEADYGNLPEVDLVIRNISTGAAKEITFGFSAQIKSSSDFIISDLPYFKEGVDFLGPEGEIRCYWDYLEDLVSSLRRQNLTKGITVTVRYKDLSGKPYADQWTINPLLYEGNRSVRQKGVEDLAEAIEDISQKIDRALEQRATPDSGDTQ